MSSPGKIDHKATLDAASWMFNVVTSVGIIIVNKALMATYGFSFGAHDNSHNIFKYRCFFYISLFAKLYSYQVLFCSKLDLF